MTDAIDEARAALKKELAIPRYRGADALEAMAAADRLALAVHDDACVYCSVGWSNRCVKRARLEGRGKPC